MAFGEIYGLSGETLKEAMRLYRKYYIDGGYKDSPLYEGIEETLLRLHDEGRILMIVTSKPKHIAEMVAEYHGMGRYLDAVIGPVEEKVKAGKEDLIETAAREVIRQLGDASLTVSDIYQEAVMVGDRKYDMEAAKQNEDEEEEAVAKPEKPEPEAPMNFEPEDEEALNLIIPKYISSLIYGALISAQASENGARMQAMDNATNNASEMIDHLALLYNRARQGKITTELTEIIAGADAIS